MLINMASKATKRPWEKGTFVAAAACEAFWRFTSGEAVAYLAFYRQWALKTQFHGSDICAV